MLRLMTSWFGSILLIASFVGSSPAQQRQPDPCLYSKGEQAIAACTRDIASGRFKGVALGGRFNNRGLAYAERGDYDRAIADYNEAIRLHPRIAIAFSNRGNIYARSDYDHAISDYNEAIRLNPRNAIFFSNRGEAYNNKGEYDHAVADFNEAIRRDPKLKDAIEGLSKAKTALANQQSP
jgi:tetratricopeptide (TPR) repeat protein